ncbi:MAG: glycine cleavage system protein H [Spirochaetes bacterium]|nr:glycine cleavage system protein H [Spirochaetota bacterium]
MFSASHVWIEMKDEFTGRCGVSTRLQQKIGRVLFVDLPDVDSELGKGEKAAMLESDTDFFDFLAPVSGKVVEINNRLVSEPWLVNDDTYGEGWVYAIEVKEPNEFDDLMAMDEYDVHLEREGDI